MSDEYSATNDHPAAAWFRRDLERVENDLLAVLREHWPQVE